MTSDLSHFSRRELLQSASAGFGYLAFAGLATQAAETESGNPLSPKQPHFPAKSRRVIFLCMQGGPSHVDTFDYKPQLAKDAGKGGKYGGKPCLMASPWEFRQHGKSGLWISDLFPELAKHADELCLIESTHCDQPTHPLCHDSDAYGACAVCASVTCAWTLYGLGTENDSMPGFVALNPPAASAQNFGLALAAAIYQGTKVGRPQARYPQAIQETMRGPHLQTSAIRGFRALAADNWILSRS